MRRIGEALPPLPRLPSRKKIATWWQDQRRQPYFPPLPHFPSRKRIAAWWRERRHHSFLPPLPRPSRKKIAAWWRDRGHLSLPPLPRLSSPADIIRNIRNRPPPEYRPVLVATPSVRKMAAWLREEPGRPKIVAWWSFAAIVLIAGAIATPYAVHAVQGWHARRIANESLLLMEQQKWKEASQKLQDASRIRNSEPEVWRAYARLLSRTGRSSAALEWWQKTAQSRNLSIEDRRDYATAALAGSEVAIASEQIEILLAQATGSAPRDFLLAAQLATVRGYNSTAIEYAQRVLTNPASVSRDKLDANLVILSNSTAGSQPYTEATGRLVEIARDENDPASPQALTVLGNQQPAARLTGADSATFALTMPEVSGNAMSLPEIADRLDHNPNSLAFHHMLALELRARADPKSEDELVARAVKSYGAGDDDTLIALAAWLHSRGRFEAMLGILPLPRVIKRRELLIEHIDALAALNRLPEVEEVLLAENPVLDPAFQHMRLAVVRLKLGEGAAGWNEWLRALETADSTRLLVSVADYAEKNGALEIADSAYANLIQKQPDLKSAYISRFWLAQKRGRTAEAHTLALEIVRLWPDDGTMRMREVYLRLLLDQSTAQAQAADDEASPFLARNPWDGIARSTLALAQLQEGKAAEALATLTEFKGRAPSSAISFPILIAALAANGWKDRAREEAKKLATVNVLPEENQLITLFFSETHP